MRNIQNVVVVMLENRSFDNMVGWLYSRQGNRPPKPIPTYDGLTPDQWNPGTSGEKVPVRQGTSGQNPWAVPTPDPQELFDHMKFQLCQTGQTPTMKGFVQDYATVTSNRNPNSIMECFTPEQVPVSSALAQGGNGGDTTNTDAGRAAAWDEMAGSAPSL